MAFVHIELDLQILICTFLHPSDILTLRKTCKTFQLVSRQRIIWVDALRRLCLENRLFSPSFPILDMSDVELEQAAIAPRRWIELYASFAPRELKDWEERRSPITALSPTATRIINNPFNGMNRLILVPGGRYMVARSRIGLAVWDLGYVSSANCKLIASNSEGELAVPESGFATCVKVHATSDGMGLVISSLSRYQHCSIYEIYPQSEAPQLTKITSLGLRSENGLHDCISVDKMIWYSLYLQETIFRVWDYRLNASVSFAALVDVKGNRKDSAEVIATQTAIVMLQEEEILIWAIPPLSPQPPNFDDYSLAQFPPVVRIRFPDVSSLRPSPRSPLVGWNVMSIWYFDPSKPFYFDKVCSRDFDHEIQSFSIIIKPDLSDTTLHHIKTLRPDTPESDHEIPFQSMVCDRGWSVSHLWSCTAVSVCSTSGRLVAGDNTNKIVVYDFLPH